MTRSGMRGRWQPSGCRSWWSGRFSLRQLPVLSLLLVARSPTAAAAPPGEVRGRRHQERRLQVPRPLCFVPGYPWLPDRLRRETRPHAASASATSTTTPTSSCSHAARSWTVPVPSEIEGAPSRKNTTAPTAATSNSILGLRVILIARHSFQERFAEPLASWEARLCLLASQDHRGLGLGVSALEHEPVEVDGDGAVGV